MGFMGFILLVPLIIFIALVLYFIEIFTKVMAVGGIALAIGFAAAFAVLKKKGKFSEEFFAELSVKSYGKYRVFGMKFLRFALIAGSVLSVLVSAAGIFLFVKWESM